MGENPYAPPSAPLETPQRPTRRAFTLATRRDRFMAAFLDSAVLAVSGVVCRSLLGWLGEPLADASLPLFRVARDVAGFVLAGGIHVACVAAFRASPGKLAVGIRMVRTSGEEASLVRLLLLRPLIFLAVQVMMHVSSYSQGPLGSFGSMCALALMLADTLAIFSSDRRCLHDKIAGTIVVVGRGR